MDIGRKRWAPRNPCGPLCEIWPPFSFQKVAKHQACLSLLPKRQPFLHGLHLSPNNFSLDSLPQVGGLGS